MPAKHALHVIRLPDGEIRAIGTIPAGIFGITFEWEKDGTLTNACIIERDGAAIQHLSLEAGLGPTDFTEAQIAEIGELALKSLKEREKNLREEVENALRYNRTGA
mgnify:CR=1 FL=1